MRQNGRGLLLSVLVVLALIAFGFIGWKVTPAPPRVLTWRDWRFLAVQRAYIRELTALRRDAQRLAEWVSGDPSLEVAWQAQQIRERWQQGGLEVLTARREAVAQAAEAVRQWAIGQRTQPQAAEAVQNALEVLAGE